MSALDLLTAAGTLQFESMPNSLCGLLYHRFEGRQALNINHVSSIGAIVGEKHGHDRSGYSEGCRFLRTQSAYVHRDWTSPSDRPVGVAVTSEIATEAVSLCLANVERLARRPDRPGSALCHKIARTRTPAARDVGVRGKRPLYRVSAAWDRRPLRRTAVRTGSRIIPRRTRNRDGWVVMGNAVVDEAVVAAMTTAMRDHRQKTSRPVLFNR